MGRSGKGKQKILYFWPNTYTCYVSEISRLLTCLCSWASQFEYSNLVAYLEDRFDCVEAQLYSITVTCITVLIILVEAETTKPSSQKSTFLRVHTRLTLWNMLLLHWVAETYVSLSCCRRGRISTSGWQWIVSRHLHFWKCFQAY